MGMCKMAAGGDVSVPFYIKSETLTWTRHATVRVEFSINKETSELVYVPMLNLDTKYPGIRWKEKKLVICEECQVQKIEPCPSCKPISTSSTVYIWTIIKNQMPELSFETELWDPDIDMSAVKVWGDVTFEMSDTIKLINMEKIFKNYNNGKHIRDVLPSTKTELKKVLTQAALKYYCSGDQGKDAITQIWNLVAAWDDKFDSTKMSEYNMDKTGGEGFQTKEDTIIFDTSSKHLEWSGKLMMPNPNGVLETFNIDVPNLYGHTPYTAYVDFIKEYRHVDPPTYREFKEHESPLSYYEWKRQQARVRGFISWTNSVLFSVFKLSALNATHVPGIPKLLI